MSEFSTSPQGRAAKAYGRVLNSLQRPGSQAALAVVLGASEATISRIKNERLEECLAFLYAAGFKLVAQGKTCVDAAALEFMRQTTARVLADEAQAAQLFRDDE